MLVKAYSRRDILENMKYQSIPATIKNGVVTIPSFVVPYCPDCGSGEVVLCPIDSDEGLAIPECICGREGTVYKIYNDPLFAEIVLDDILDANVIG